MNGRTNTYTGYGIGCAVVWSVILIIGRRRLDTQDQKMLRLVCGGWWIGWTSATIARIGFPPPKQLTPLAERRLRAVSTVLVALGLANTIRVLARRRLDGGPVGVSTRHVWGRSHARPLTGEPVHN